MGKKITSSSPLDTIAFDAIPNTWTYANAFTAIKGPDVTSAGGSSGTGGDQGYYRSTRGNSGFEVTETGCPIGKKKDDNNICVKRKKRSRGERLTDKIREDEAMGKTASAARRRKSLAGWELGQEKRTAQIESGKTFFGRIFSNVGDIVTPGVQFGDYKKKLNKKGKWVPGKPNIDKTQSRHDLKLTRAGEIKTQEGKVKKQAEIDKCNNTSGKKWDTAKGCIDLAKTNFNPIVIPKTTTAKQKCEAQGRTWHNNQCW